MSRKFVLILVFLLFLVCLGYPRFQQNGVRASDAYPVHNLNTGLNYSTIQEAVNANETLDGDVIHVDAGTYVVNDTFPNIPNIINKSVSLVGDGMENTTLVATSSVHDVCFFVVSNHVNISDFTLRNAWYGVMTNANYVHITNCNISDNDIGIEISSHGAGLLVGEVIDGNILMNNTSAMSLYIYNSVVCHNFISNNGAGISIPPELSQVPTGNLLHENTIANSSSRQPPRSTALIIGGQNNTVLLNNFLDTTIEAVGENTWDSRLNTNDLLWGGNYYSDYNETNKYGMGTTPYVIDSNNIDHHPLTGMVNIFDVPYGNEVAVISNSTISDFQFTLTNQSQAALDFKVSGENGSLGFCWIILPQVVINYSQTWTVTLDGDHWNTHEYSIATNQTHWNFWIDYTHSMHQIKIAGVTILPEFPTFLIPALLMIAALLAVIVYKRRHLTRV